MITQHFLADLITAYELIQSGVKIPRRSLVTWQGQTYSVDSANGYCLTLIALDPTSPLAWASVDVRSDKTVIVSSIASRS